MNAAIQTKRETNGEPWPEARATESANQSDLPAPGGEGKYVALAPSGTEIRITKELFVALHDFMRTRKSPGSVTIQFRNGQITSVEAVAKKTYHTP